MQGTVGVYSACKFFHFTTIERPLLCWPGQIVFLGPRNLIKLRSLRSTNNTNTASRIAESMASKDSQRSVTPSARNTNQSLSNNGRNREGEVISRTIGIHIENFASSPRSSSPGRRSPRSPRSISGIPRPISPSPTRAQNTSKSSTKVTNWISDKNHPYRQPLASPKSAQTYPSKVVQQTKSHAPLRTSPAKAKPISLSSSSKFAGAKNAAPVAGSQGKMNTGPQSNYSNSRNPPRIQTTQQSQMTRDVYSAPGPGPSSSNPYRNYSQNSQSQYSSNQNYGSRAHPSTKAIYQQSFNHSSSNTNYAHRTKQNLFVPSGASRLHKTNHSSDSPDESSSLVEPKKKLKTTVADQLISSFNLSETQTVEEPTYSLHELFKSNNSIRSSTSGYSNANASCARYTSTSFKLQNVRIQNQPVFPRNSNGSPYFPNHLLHLPASYVPRQGLLPDGRFYSTRPPPASALDYSQEFIEIDESDSAESLDTKERARHKLRKLRKWEFTTLGRLYLDSRQYGARTMDGGTKFTILSYNILSPTLLSEHQDHLYKNTDPECLDWTSRYELFMEELKDFGYPDILCFQEVEATLFEEYFEAPLAKKGYKGLFKKRTGNKVDGCAIFWKQAVFTLLAKLPVEYFQPHVPLLDRDNIALLVKLQSKIGKRPKLVVGTTHLLFNPKRNDVKLAQVQVILSELDRFAFAGHTKDGEPTYHPIILTGDFNTEPRSSIVRLITDGELQYTNQHGERPKLLIKKGMNDFIPNYVGLSDQCQHYRVVLERFKHWHTNRYHEFEIEQKEQEKLINLYSSHIAKADANEDIKSEVDPIDHAATINAINTAGAVCTFGAGELSHKLKMCDIYQPRLDRSQENLTDSIATTKQAIWVCVDYIFYSKIWNEKDGRRMEGNLKLLRRLGLLTRNQCKELGGLPSFAVSSDHYPLLAEFVIK